MAAFSEGTGLMQGDFLDGVVESALRGMVSQLKAEYRKELGRALKTATSEGAVRASVDPVDDPMVTVPALNTPEDQFSEDQKGKPSQLKTASSTPVVHFSEDQKVRTSKLNPASADSSIGNVDNVEPIWLTPECSDGERSSGKVSTRAWRETLWSKSNGNGRGERTTVTGLWEETMDKLPEDMRTSKVVLTKEDQKEIVRLRAEQIKREEAAKAIVRDFTFIVEPAPDDASRCKKLCFNIVASQRFDFGMGFVIMLNALAIGSETAISRHGGQLPASLHILEYTFLLLYIVELSMRVYVGGLEAFSNNWVRFDAVMVAAGILNFLLTVTFLGGDTAAGLADNINMIKMIRLFRLAKTVRVFPQFRTLWMLVQGVMYAVMPMIWTAILMTVVIYVFAVIAMEIIVVSDEEDGYSIAARNYDTLGGAMMTLMQFMMFDSCAIIYKPIITMKPWLIVYFVVYLLVGPIALLSIVNAIHLPSSLPSALPTRIRRQRRCGSRCDEKK
ncbi:unnamed protein product [Prorocentrum cordatum]|uniref:Ion transport domain-containing protein n=1 Tax=Prorocentrum cordatum TaxID=2364126 RepID=A0ABN9URX5_9DINO|nr:unnamed protein product [Polarella glacialis]